MKSLPATRSLTVENQPVIELLPPVVGQPGYKRFLPPKKHRWPFVIVIVAIVGIVGIGIAADLTKHAQRPATKIGEINGGEQAQQGPDILGELKRLIAAVAPPPQAAAAPDQLSILDAVAAAASKQGVTPPAPQTSPEAIQPPPIQGVDLMSRPASGVIRLYPLELGNSFSFKLGYKDYSCSAESHSELLCRFPEITSFRAAIAAQGRHEYLVGCKWEFASDSCMDLAPGIYSVLVHGSTLIVTDSTMAERNRFTGAFIRSLTPVFSVLKKLK